MQLDRRTTKQLLIIAAGAAAVYAALQHFGDLMGVVRRIYSLFSPFLLGGAVAFIINVPMRAVERVLFSNLPREGKHVRIYDGLRRAARALSLVLTLLLLFGALYLVFSIIVPEIVNSLGMLGNSLPGFAKRVTEVVANLGRQYPTLAAQLDDALSNVRVDWQTLLSSAVKTLGGAGASILLNAVSVTSSLMGGLFRFVLALVFAIYVLLQKEKLAAQIERAMRAYLNERVVNGTLHVLRLSEHTFSRFLSGQCVEAAILGTLFFITMSIFRFPYALMISVLIAVLAFVPMFGSIIGCVTGALLILIVAPQKVLWFIILFLVVQQIEGNFIYPHIVGSSVGLSAIWVLVAVTLGGGLMGVAGMLLFIPICSVCYALLRDDIYRRTGGEDAPPKKAP